MASTESAIEKVLLKSPVDFPRHVSFAFLYEFCQVRGAAIHFLTELVGMVEEKVESPIVSSAPSTKVTEDREREGVEDPMKFSPVESFCLTSDGPTDGSGQGFGSYFINHETPHVYTEYIDPYICHGSQTLADSLKRALLDLAYIFVAKEHSPSVSICLLDVVNVVFRNFKLSDRRCRGGKRACGICVVCPYPHVLASAFDKISLELIRMGDILEHRSFESKTEELFQQATAVPYLNDEIPRMLDILLNEEDLYYKLNVKFAAILTSLVNSYIYEIPTKETIASKCTPVLRNETRHAFPSLGRWGKMLKSTLGNINGNETLKLIFSYSLAKGKQVVFFGTEQLCNAMAKAFIENLPHYIKRTCSFSTNSIGHQGQIITVKPEACAMAQLVGCSSIPPCLQKFKPRLYVNVVGSTCEPRVDPLVMMVESSSYAIEALDVLEYLGSSKGFYASMRSGGNGTTLRRPPCSPSHIVERYRNIGVSDMESTTERELLQCIESDFNSLIHAVSCSSNIDTAAMIAKQVLGLDVSDAETLSFIARNEDLSETVIRTRSK